MKIAYYFVFLVFAINLASGMVSSWIGPMTEGDMGGIGAYDETHNDPFKDSSFEQPFGVAAEASDNSDSTGIWDLLGLGFVQTWIQTTSKYIYGVNSLMYSIFSGYMTNDESTWEATGRTYEQEGQKSQLDYWFGCSGGQDCIDNGTNGGILGLIISAMWVLAAIGLFVGKNFFED